MGKNKPAPWRPVRYVLRLVSTVVLLNLWLRTVGPFSNVGYDSHWGYDVLTWLIGTGLLAHLWILEDRLMALPDQARYNLVKLTIMVFAIMSLVPLIMFLVMPVPIEIFIGFSMPVGAAFAYRLFDPWYLWRRGDQ